MNKGMLSHSILGLCWQVGSVEKAVNKTGVKEVVYTVIYNVINNYLLGINIYDWGFEACKCIKIQNGELMSRQACCCGALCSGNIVRPDLDVNHQGEL